MEICCSFKSVVGGPCTFDRKDRKGDTQVIPLLSCQKDVSGHLSTCKFSGPENVECLNLGQGMVEGKPRSGQKLIVELESENLHITGVCVNCTKTMSEKEDTESEVPRTTDVVSELSKMRLVCRQL